LDGERDYKTIPTLAKKVLGREIKSECTSWVRLHRSGVGRGYFEQ
jgi:hypothetical protein